VKVDDRAVIEELQRAYFSAAPHEQDVLRAIEPLLRAARFFVDIGASLGQFTKHASLTMPGGRILAVEADPLRARELESNCASWQMRSHARIEAVHAAVTDHDGLVRLSVTDSAVSGGLFRHSLDDLSPDHASRVQWREVEVQALTLDTLCDGVMPDLVKIDVEGAELRVLRGAKDIIRRETTLFLVELHPWRDPGGQSSPAEVIAFMAGLGYHALPFAGKTLFVGRIGRATSLMLSARSLAMRIKGRLQRGWS
jgi:FkbM family methyltransferase